MSDWDILLSDDKDKKPSLAQPVVETKPEPVKEKPSDADSVFGDLGLPPKETAKPVEVKVPPPSSTSAFDDLLGPNVSVPSVQVQQQVQVQQPQTPSMSIPEARGVGRPKNFDYSEARPTAQLVVVTYGEKGIGKTYSAFTLPGVIACLSFDRMSVPIKQNFFANDSRIHVYDAIRYYHEESSTERLDSAVDTYEYVLSLLNNVISKLKTDWIIIDGTDILSQICEMVMRARKGLGPFQGFKELVYWKERTMYMNEIHKICLENAKMGVIYTTYIQTDEINQKQFPKYVGNIMYQSSVVIRIRAERDKSGQRFRAFVDSSKVKQFTTGAEMDITDVGLKALFNPVPLPVSDIV